jgi:hypothetical protein
VEITNPVWDGASEFIGVQSSINIEETKLGSEVDEKRGREEERHR